MATRRTAPKPLIRANDDARRAKVFCVRTVCSPWRGVSVIASASHPTTLSMLRLENKTANTVAASVLRYDPEYLAIVSAGDRGEEGPAPFKDVWELGAWSEPVLRAVLRAQPSPDDVLETRIALTSHDGAEISLVRFATRDMAEAPEPQAAVVYVHGGGFVTCDVDIFAPQDECVEVVGKLAAADVEVEFHLWPGLPHGFESAPGIGWVEKALEARNDALRRA
ncbi:hypothetical protein CTRI78_v007059 [Colletotrichum trifolii]|uniref:Alpha/beta hydrolase fold-3 domain-containing protein n=1 Tax=Colletotrichum trifolii TaxID=5466 RepID=A0A4V3HVZ1_COLTR|nr:hypothetical protein CTRI78_v007059 [Colletotrichum trifolii]